MFLESNITGLKRGWIEVICGSMFSGKTEELIRRLKRAQLAKQKLEIYKPLLDNRYHKHMVTSHQGNELNSIPVPNSKAILLKANQFEVIGIDEAQFFDDDLPEVCSQLASNGIRVIIAGLDLDYMAQPFGSMPKLMAMAEFVTKLHAICLHCGHLAYVSHRKVKDENLVLLGELDHYEPLCRDCFNKVAKI